MRSCEREEQRRRVRIMKGAMETRSSLFKPKGLNTCNFLTSNRYRISLLLLNLASNTSYLSKNIQTFRNIKIVRKRISQFLILNKQMKIATFSLKAPILTISIKGPKHSVDLSEHKYIVKLNFGRTSKGIATKGIDLKG